MVRAHRQRIRSVADIIEAAKIAAEKFKSEVWWRGQADESWDLVPGIRREQHGDLDEVKIFDDFKLSAPARYRNPPADEDETGWLMLMQRSGLPTRLLEWCGSPLAAAYFAIEDAEAKSPGALWGVSRNLLNIQFSGHTKVRTVSTGTRSKNNPVAITTGDEHPTIKAQAIEPDAKDARTMIQQSKFIQHNSCTPLNNLSGAEKFLIRFNIPSEAKVLIEKELRVLGIRRSTLFPDLENLAADLSNQTNRKIKIRPNVFDFNSSPGH
jgi:FRG domain